MVSCNNFLQSSDQDKIISSKNFSGQGILFFNLTALILIKRTVFKICFLHPHYPCCELVPALHCLSAFHFWDAFFFSMF